MSSIKGAGIGKRGELVTLEVAQGFGFVVYGIGVGANHCTFRKQKLMDFLGELGKQMQATKKSVNTSWKELDKANPSAKKNVALVNDLLSAAIWAYGLTVELQPFEEACKHGPTYPLRHIYIQRLEEIYTKCFAAAHIWGIGTGSEYGLVGLIKDFEDNGGINKKTGSPGGGFHQSLFDYYRAYFNPNKREDVVYHKFSTLLQYLAGLIATRYPKCLKNLMQEYNDFLENQAPGFASTEFTSPAKVELVSNLKLLVKAFHNEEAVLVS